MTKLPDEDKKKSGSISLLPKTWSALDEEAKKQGRSRSNLIETILTDYTVGKK